MPDIIRRGLRVPFQKFLRHQDKTRRTKSALERTVFDEGLLDWMKLVSTGEPFDSHDFTPVNKRREIQAAAHSQTIDECRAAAAEALAAAFSPSEQTEITAQHINQRF